jgi:hypothetical protein
MKKIELPSGEGLDFLASDILDFEDITSTQPEKSSPVNVQIGFVDAELGVDGKFVSIVSKPDEDSRSIVVSLLCSYEEAFKFMSNMKTTVELVSVVVKNDKEVFFTLPKGTVGEFSVGSLIPSGSCTFTVEIQPIFNTLKVKNEKSQNQGRR